MIGETSQASFGPLGHQHTGVSRLDERLSVCIEGWLHAWKIETFQKIDGHGRNLQDILDQKKRMCRVAHRKLYASGWSSTPRSAARKNRYVPKVPVPLTS